MTSVDEGYWQLLQDIHCDKVMVLCTARIRGLGPQRLPNRSDRGEPVAAIQVETAKQARDVLGALDRSGRQIFVDIERKHNFDLLAIALETVDHAMVMTTKPNDTTVDALVETLKYRWGQNISHRRILIYGTGNLGFKIALRLAECNAQVSITGRNEQKAELLAQSITAILPKFNDHPVSTVTLDRKYSCLVSSAAATGVLDASWINLLAPNSLCIDIGINNFTSSLIARALAEGHDVRRLDVRAAGDPLPVPIDFFETTQGRAQIDGIRVVAGGILGHLGDVVLDSLTNPTLAIGVADGAGGLLSKDGQSSEQSANIEKVNCYIREGRFSVSQNDAY